MRTEFTLSARKRLAGDPHRPLYHFLPPANWMNDPNGLIQWKGSYHLFYQHNPEGAAWGNMHWGHAACDDLVHWRDLPVALAPTPNSPDKDGVWTGCTVDDGGVPRIFYTARDGEKESVCLATSRDDLLTWEKDPANPIIPAPPGELSLSAWRDPFIWSLDGNQFMVIGAGKASGGGAALLYRSSDLRNWEYLGPMLSEDTDKYGIAWECPNFFRDGQQDALIFSAMGQGKAVYFTGTFDGRRFTARKSGDVDAGGYLYAPQLFVDRTQEGKRIVLIGWSWEGRSLEAQAVAGWAGVMTLPRVLSITEAGELASSPVPEILSLRGEQVVHPDQALAAGEETWLPLKGTCQEISLEVEARTGLAGLKVNCSPDGSEETELTWDSQASKLIINRDRSSLSDSVIRDEKAAEILAESLNLRIFLDRSILEVYANGTCCMTSRVYPSRADSQGVKLFCRQGRAKFREIKQWQMKAVWPESLE